GQSGIYEMLGKIYEGKGGTFIVIAGGYDKFGLSKLRNLKNVLIIVTLGGILIFLLSGWFFTLRALKPVAGIVSKAEQMSPENLHERLDEGNGKDELGRMARAFNQLFERIEEAFKLQKTFVANASHELRTPLTIITGQLELLLLKPETEGHVKASIEEILEDMKRLNRITNALLLLAQTEHNSNDMTVSPVQLDDVLWQVINELKYSRPDIRFHVNFLTPPQSESDFRAEGNALLFRTVILNICDNACKFSSDSQVYVSLDYDNKYVKFICTNYGKAVPAEELKFLFQPFFRSTNSTGVRGHGLGLALVDKIVKLHEGQINVESASEKTTFTIEFRHSLKG
ncbi:MAG: HAMP domain-containing protein, partial [Bacteroidetes bacterium]|nr:HAMP domain-containing protein [Bacteroidota bacterium]